MPSRDNTKLAVVTSSRLRFAAWVALLVEMSAIAWCASFGHIQQMQVQSLFMLSDTSAHMLAFLVAGLTASLAARYVICPAIALSGVAGIVEVMQFFIPGRSASTLDFAASLVGVAIGSVFGAVLWPALLRRRSRA